MISLPIPVIVALLLVFLLVRFLRREGQVSPYLAGLLFACAVQSLLVALVQHYGFINLRLWQPVLAVVIPPLAWLAFLDGVMRPLALKQDWMNVVAPLFMVLSLTFWSGGIDLVIIVTFAFYGAAILITLARRGGDLPLARLAAGMMPVWIWRMIALALIASALSDVLIALAIASNMVWLKNWILSIFSSAALLAIGALGLSPDSQGEREALDADSAEEQGALNHQSQEDLQKRHEEIIARLDALIEEDQLYLDPDLTLIRLARRLGYPAKHVSMAVNQQCGENLSRYINGHRIRHACTLLKAGESVTSAMLASGFNTKSNFNREFPRITGLSPSQWKRKQLG